MALRSRAAGYESYWCLISDLVWRNESLWVFARPFDGEHKVEPGTWLDANHVFKGVFVRTDPPVGREYLAALWLLDAGAEGFVGLESAEHTQLGKRENINPSIS